MFSCRMGHPNKEISAALSISVKTGGVSSFKGFF